jgi:hypothetical protein
MKAFSSFVSPWALVGLAVWLVVMVIAYNWAIPIYANLGGPGLCPAESPNCSPATFTVTQPDTTVFALIVASLVTGLLTAIVLLTRAVIGRAAKAPSS